MNRVNMWVESNISPSSLFESFTSVCLCLWFLEYICTSLLKGEKLDHWRADKTRFSEDVINPFLSKMCFSYVYVSSKIWPSLFSLQRCFHIPLLRGRSPCTFPKCEMKNVPQANLIRSKTQNSLTLRHIDRETFFETTTTKTPTGKERWWTSTLPCFSLLNIATTGVGSAHFLNEKEIFQIFFLLFMWETHFQSIYTNVSGGISHFHFQGHICILSLSCDMSPCFNVQKALYFSHTACAASPLFTLCLKSEPSLLWLVSWPAVSWLVNRLEMSRTVAY